jgi:hypothetical protein
MRKLTGEQKAAGAQMDAFRMQNLSFGKVMNMSMKNFQAFNKQGFKFNRIGGKMANRIRLITHGLKGFRMEALGVMFFGMALVGMFKKLFAPISEAFGITELFSLMLVVLLLPIMMLIFPWLLKLLMFFMNLPDGVKMAIGIFIILAGIFGAIIMVAGMLALGLGSLILYWPVIAGAATSAMAAVAGAFWPIIAVIALVILIFIGMKLAWEENFLGMRQIIEWFVSGFKDLFSGLITFFTGLWLIVKGLFTGDWELIWEGVIKVFKGAQKAIWGLVKILVTGIAAIMIGIIKITMNIHKAIVEFWMNLPGKIWDAIKGIGAMITKAFTDGVPSWIIKMIKGGGKLVSSIFNGGGGSSGPSQSEDDFIWRPGQGAVGINPNDTLVGFKGAPPNFGGGGSEGGSVTNNFYGFTMEELKRELDYRDRQLVADIERNK